MPAPASRSATPLDRQIEALYAILVDVMGTEKLVIQAGKMKALDLMRSADPCERVLALQRILGEDPLINPAPKPEQVPAIMDALSERVADIVARRNVEDSIEKNRKSMSVLEESRRQDDEFVRFFEAYGNIQRLDREIMTNLVDHVVYYTQEHMEIYFRFSDFQQKILDLAFAVAEQDQVQQSPI